MSVGSLVVLLASLPAGPLPPPPPPPATPAAPAAPADKETLESAHIAAADGPALLDFLHKRSGAAADKAQVAALVKQLADGSTRDAAAGRLVVLGEAAVPALREAANNLDDPDFANRARQCIDNIEGSHGAALSVAAVRAVAALKPDGAADALLQFLPYAEDDKVEQEVESALAAVALNKDGKPESAVVRALADATPVRRGAAAAVLCRVGADDQTAAVRELLKDPKPTVRFRAAMALADAYSSDAVPVLIDLLAELPTEQRKQAEEYLTNLAGEWAVAGPQGNDVTSGKVRRDAWAAWWNGIDDKVLLHEFRSRTMTDDERDQALGLIQKLDDVSAEVREKAQTELLGMGRRVAPLLRQAAAGANPRLGQVAQNVLQMIEKDSPNPLPAAAGRMLALRAPDGAVATLLAYLPYTDSEQADDQLRGLLNSLAAHDAKAVPVLVKTLDDKIGARRSAAAVALARRGAGDNLAAVKKLFKDPDADVRFRTAAAVLSYAKDKDAVPVLIGLLTDLPQDRVWQAESVLVTVAGDKAPSSSLADADGRKKAVADWTAWWTANAAAVDLAKIDFGEDHELGYLLVVETNFPGKVGGRVLEQDSGGKVRWAIENVQWPQDAQVAGPNRVVMIDLNGQHVCEREIHTNKVIWETNVNQGFRVQRLPNGNTFVACRNGLMEYDRNGNQVVNLQRPNEWLLDAQMMPNGQIAMLNNQGQYTRMDAKGEKELKSAHVPFNPNFGINGAQVLPNDHVIVTVWNTGKITEYDADGKEVLEAAVQQASSFFRLSNGHLLVTCMNQTQIDEVDQSGKVVVEMKNLPFHPWRVSRRSGKSLPYQPGSASEGIPCWRFRLVKSNQEPPRNSLPRILYAYSYSPFRVGGQPAAGRAAARPGRRRRQHPQRRADREVGRPAAGRPRPAGVFPAADEGRGRARPPGRPDRAARIEGRHGPREGRRRADGHRPAGRAGPARGRQGPRLGRGGRPRPPLPGGAAGELGQRLRRRRAPHRPAQAGRRDGRPAGLSALRRGRVAPGRGQGRPDRHGLPRR